MVFNGISRIFKLTNQQQFDTIGRFWDEMAALHGLENLMGLGYFWTEDEISYAIGLKHGDIPSFNVSIVLPDCGWMTVREKTDCLQELYDEIYKAGNLQYEIETFNNDGTCEIRYWRTAPG